MVKDRVAVELKMPDNLEQRVGNGHDYLDVSYSQSRKPENDYPRQLCSRIADRYFERRSGTLLDVGCGRGDQIRALADMGFSVKGCDMSPRSKDLADGSYDVEIVDFERAEFPWKEEQFDVLLCKSVIEHMAQPDELVSECLRVLKPGGRAVFMTPDWESMYRIFYSEYTHRTPFTKKSLGDCLLINGFGSARVDKLTQLPWLWKWPALKPLCWLLARCPEGLRRFKSVRFSKDVMLIAVAEKARD